MKYILQLLWFLGIENMCATYNKMPKISKTCQSLPKFDKTFSKVKKKILKYISILVLTFDFYFIIHFEIVSPIFFNVEDRKLVTFLMRFLNLDHCD